MGAMRKWMGTAVLMCAAVSGLSAQVVADRVKGEINPLETVPLAGSANPHAQSANEIGSLPADTRLSGITLHFALPAAQKADLDALVLAQQTPGSAFYHQWLTPTTFAARYGISDNDLAKVRSWLEQQGFSIDGVSNSRTSIRFSGTAAQVEAAFGTKMRRYTVNGETHFANATALSIPAALEGTVGAVRNLHDFRPKPGLRIRPASESKTSPLFTSSQSGVDFMTPKDVATIYDINAAYNAGYTGAGQSIAVVGQSEITVTDIEAFQSAAGLTVKDPTLVLVPGSGTAAIVSGDEAESDLDLEYSGGIAKGATLYFVYVGNNSSYSVWNSVAYAIDNKVAPVISMSYGDCELDMSTSEFNTLDLDLEQGASQGQTIIVSSGDSGSTACYADVTSSTTISSITSTEKALSVNYPASSAYVTALGGTEFPATDVCLSNGSGGASCGSNASTYWSTANGSDVISSAKSYIPEVVWNDDSASVGAAYGPYYALSSGGGGVSTYTKRPSWQTGVTGITTAPDYSGGYRLVPDISLNSSPNNPGYLYCSSDSNSTGISGSCANGFRNSAGTSLTVAGGTSFAAPIFAGMVAILNQKENSVGQGVIASTLYWLASSSTTYASAFHDITSGSNACTAGSNYCSTAGAAEYSATTGYDEATGLGSVDLYNLISAWPSGVSSIIKLSAATTTPSSGASDTIAITVASMLSSSTATPTGTISIAVDGTSVVTSENLSSGAASYSFSSTTSGVHTVQVTYSGDTNYAPSIGSIILSVGSTTSSSGSFTVALSPSSVTISSGGSGTTSAIITPANSYSGTVKWDLTTTSSYLQSDACYTINSASVSGTSAVSTTLTLYMGTSACSASGASKSGVLAFKAAGSMQQASRKQKSDDRLSVRIAAGGFGLLVLVGAVRRRRKVLGALLALVIMGWLGVCLTACSSSTSSSSSTGTNVPKGSYTISVEGYDSTTSSISSTATLAVTVD